MNETCVNTDEKKLDNIKLYKTTSIKPKIKKTKRSIANTSKKDKMFNCEYCGKSFISNTTLKIHIRTHTGVKPFKCPICDKSFSQSGHLADHSRTHTGEKPYQCSDCGKSFGHKTHLNAHMRIHTGEKPYKCKICSKSFSQLHALKYHSNVHTGGSLYKYPALNRDRITKKFNCDICGATFKLRHSFKVHILSHSGEKPYICDLCNKGFSQSSHLNDHLLTHSGGKKRTVNKKQSSSHPYRCPQCGARFAGLSALKNHAEKHTGIKAFKCGICGRCFTSQFLLASHMRTHTGEKPYQCEICSKCFSQRSVLVCHLRMHSGDKRYTCEICTKSFISRSDLTKHTRTHTGEKPYKCEFCSSCFSRSNHLTRHMKIHFESKKPSKNSVIKANSSFKPNKNNAVPELNSVKLSNLSCFDTNESHLLYGKALFNINLMTYQSGLLDFQNYVSMGGIVNDERNLDMPDNNMHFNSNINLLEHDRYQTLTFNNTLRNVYDKKDGQHLFDSCNLYEQYPDIYAHLDNFNLDREKIEKFYESDAMKKFAIVKNSCKWLHQNSGCHMKSSCEEMKLQTADNHNPWQCGICDTGFPSQTELNNHVNVHKYNDKSIKYTKLVTNLQSGELEVKEIIPREKLKIVSKEKLQPIIDQLLLMKNPSTCKNDDLEYKDIFTLFQYENKIENLPDMSNIEENNFEHAIEDIPNSDVDIINVDVRSDIEKFNVPSTGGVNDSLFKVDGFLPIATKLDVDCKDQTVNCKSYDQLSDDAINTKEEILVSKPKINKVKQFSSATTKTLCKNKKSNIKKFTCSICSKDFKFSNSLKVHLRCHTGERPYKCKVCKRTFAQKGCLLQHERIHSGEKPYQCWKCGTSFLNSTTLKCHMKTHTGEKPFECDVCLKKFLRKNALKIHKNTHTGETPYKCEHCGKGFRQPSSLNTHLNIHTGNRPYKCDLCDSAFSQQSTLKIHRRIHTGERPYKCEICDNTFTSNSDLRKHEATHSKEKPYVCTATPACQKAFRRNSHLKRHMELHGIVQNTLEQKNVELYDSTTIGDNWII